MSLPAPASPSPATPTRVLVLIATYNAGPWLDAQVDSVLAQQGVEVHIVVSDHGSTDDTVASLAARSAAGQPIEILPGLAPGRGSAANFFRLLRDCSLDGFEYVALCDQDDVWRPERLRRAVEQMAARGAVGYSSDVLAVWPDGRRVPVRKSQPQRAMDYLLEPAGPGCTYVLHRSFAATLRAELQTKPERFDAIRQHDWVIYAYARTHGLPWLIDPYEGLEYRQHAANEVGANVGMGGIWRRWERATSGLFRLEVARVGRLWPGVHERMVARFERFSLYDQLVIALSALKLRRRPKDQLALFSMIVLRVLR
jgi:rhamnosyltransferase